MSFQSGRLWSWICSGQIGNWSKTSGLWYKMDEDRWGLNADFATNSLRFSMPTRTHESDNHNNSYGYPKTVGVRSFSGTTRNWFSLHRLETRTLFWTSAGITILSLLLAYLIRVTLWHAHDLYVLTKTKELIRYCGSHVFGGEGALNKRFYHFNAS
jgi:hypothetical protein